MIDTLGRFRELSRMCRGYPKVGPKIEDYFYERWLNNPPDNIRRHYLPIFWTHVYCKYGIGPGSNKEYSRELQKFMNEQVTEPSFTIVQADDGLYEEPPENLLVFGAGGKGDIPIPLTYNIVTVPVKGDRDVFAYFAGHIKNPPNNRTGVRGRMNEALKGLSDFSIKDTKHDPLHRMGKCIFALCPRGYGRTSFRICEALAYGAIPVYIYDVLWLPYADVLNWCEFSVQCHIDDIDRLPDILRSHTSADIARKQERVREVWPEYFTLEATYNHILRMLQNETTDLAHETRNADGN